MIYRNDTSSDIVVPNKGIVHPGKTIVSSIYLNGLGLTEIDTTGFVEPNFYSALFSGDSGDSGVIGIDLTKNSFQFRIEVATGVLGVVWNGGTKKEIICAGFGRTWSFVNRKINSFTISYEASGSVGSVNISEGVA